MVVQINDPADIIYFISKNRGSIIYTESTLISALIPLVNYNTSDLIADSRFDVERINRYNQTGKLILPNDRIVKRKFQVIDTLDSVSKKLIFWHRLTIYIGPLDKYTFNNRKLSYVDCPNYLEAAQWIKHARNLHLTNPVNIAIAKCLCKKIL